MEEVIWSIYIFIESQLYLFQAWDQKGIKNK